MRVIATVLIDLAGSISAFGAILAAPRMPKRSGGEGAEAEVVMGMCYQVDEPHTIIGLW